MIDFPNAKINLGLRVLDKRPDGFHSIATMFYPVKQLYDVLEIIESPVFKFECAGPYSAGLSDDNLCVKAYLLLKEQFALPPVHIYLYKNIPVGGGLGGGSSDAAFTLKSLNTLFALKLTIQQLIDYAAILGSDCPFFILNTPQYATGRGEIMEHINLDLSAYKIEITMPDATVNTAWAYGQLDAEGGHKVNDIQDAIKMPIEGWREKLFNDFEQPIFKKHRVIEQAKNSYYDKGAVYAAMSGSGAAVYAIFR